MPITKKEMQELIAGTERAVEAGSELSGGLGALLLETETGLLAIRKDAVTGVIAETYGGRNLSCSVNGIKTKAGFDFVLSALGWATQECA